MLKPTQLWDKKQAFKLPKVAHIPSIIIISGARKMLQVLVQGTEEVERRPVLQEVRKTLLRYLITGRFIISKIVLLFKEH